MMFISETRREKAEKSFIDKARTIHGEKFDYSKVEYIDSRTPIKIICIVHGEFTQSPAKHTTSKYACNKCQLESKKTDYQSFAKQALHIHQGRYVYEPYSNKRKDEKIRIFCIEHNCYFEQEIRFHLKGHIGCKQCLKETKQQNLSSRHTKEFIELFTQKFGSNFDFSKVKYINNTAPVLIKCLHHNIEFHQTRQNFIRYTVCSCPLCKKERRNKK